MIVYIIKSSLCLVLILFVYKVLLERERMYKFNRYYLLFGLCFALIVPFITMEIAGEIPVSESTPVINFDSNDLDKVAPIVNETEQVTTSLPIWIVTLIGLYVIGYLVFFMRFMNNIYKIFYKITRNAKAFYKKASLVLLKENTLPHTFLHYIFIEKEAYETKNIAEELYTHELAHVTQKHTLDIILIELIQIVFWFNPLLIYYKKAIQLNHEFLADDAVLKSNIQIPTYQQLLLDNASWNHNLYLASNLNFSVTKKRLQMMTKHTSRIRAWLFASLTIPIFIGALFLFSTKVIAQEATAEIVEIPVIKTTSTQDPKAAYYKNATFIFEDENGNKTVKKYAELTQEEKARLMPAPKTPIAKRPTAKLLNDWKDKKGFAIWLDKKVIDNSEISNYDIVHYTGSFVHKNARSKRFPQSYQMQLYTAAGFEELKKDLASPLGKSAVLHFKKGKHGKKVGVVSTKVKTAKEELAEANKLQLNYVNENNGPNEMVLPSKQDNIIINKGGRDIRLLINKNGEFLVNEDYVCKLHSLDKVIKTELAKIKHKKSRTASIVYDKLVSEDIVNDAIAILKNHKIYNITTRSSNSKDEIRLPPPPPTPKKIKVVKEVKAPKPKKAAKASKPKKPTVVEVKEVKAMKAPKPKKPVVIEVVEMPNVTEERAKDISKMHKNIKGKDLKTMTINGEKYYYIIKNGVKYIYNKNSQLVDENGKVIPPPPKKKKGKAGHVAINGETYYYTIKNDQRFIYNRFGQSVDENGKLIQLPSKKKKKV